MSVYFAQSGAYVKIGYSADPISRVSTVTTSGARPVDLPRGADARLLGWVPGDRDALPLAGEWFYLDPAVVRALIWADPHGVDVARMSALAVFVACANPDWSRDQIGQAGVRVEAAPWSEALRGLDAVLGGAA